MHWFTSNKTKADGRRHYSEDLALKYLKRRGLKLLMRNYYSRHGEIDLIMQDKDTLVFVEVRYRKSDGYGGAAESVDLHKQSRIANTAESYLQAHPWDGPCRFDIVAIQGETKPQWIVGAFDGPQET